MNSDEGPLGTRVTSAKWTCAEVHERPETYENGRCSEAVRRQRKSKKARRCCIVFGKLGEFAGGLKKGAHVMVEGELRSRKYDSTKLNAEVTIWEIRVDSILELDRAAKAGPDEQETDESPVEEAAA